MDLSGAAGVEWIVRTRGVTIVLLALLSGIGHFRWLSSPVLEGWTMVQWRVAALAAAVAIGGLAAFRIRSAAMVTVCVAVGLLAGGTAAQLAGGGGPYVIDAGRAYVSTLWFDAVSQAAAAGLAARLVTRIFNRHPSQPRAAQAAHPERSLQDARRR